MQRAKVSDCFLVLAGVLQHVPVEKPHIEMQPPPRTACPFDNGLVIVYWQSTSEKVKTATAG